MNEQSYFQAPPSLPAHPVRAGEEREAALLAMGALQAGGEPVLLGAGQLQDGGLLVGTRVEPTQGI